MTGIVDPGEHPAHAVVREIVEETGVHCVLDALVWVNVTEPVVLAELPSMDPILRDRIVTAKDHAGPVRLA